jgi:hypothetical protein
MSETLPSVVDGISVFGISKGYIRTRKRQSLEGLLLRTFHLHIMNCVSDYPTRLSLFCKLLVELISPGWYEREQ